MTSPSSIAISYHLTFSTPFHCGTGLRGGLIDRLIVRDSEGDIYVPGSTLKGILREHCVGLEHLYAVEQKHRQLIISPHDTQAALWLMQGPVSMVTRIFGTLNRPGRLFFDDARLSADAKSFYKEKQQKLLQTDVYTQARMHRLTQTAERGALYTSEFGSKHIVVEGQINGVLDCTPIEEGESQLTYSLLLLLAGLHLLRNVGANQSAGRGQCTCKLSRLTVNGNVIDANIWNAWLDKLDKLAHYYEKAAYVEEGI